MTLPAGARLGPYEILELVGAGGMGEVYRARDPRLGRDVAIKVLPTEMACDPKRLARFEREARAVAALNHPNILTVFDVGTSPAVESGASATASAIPYVVTELLQGETLREMVSHRAPNQRQVLGFAVQIAQGLDAAHATGIVHRDIKPENVFVTTDGRVKVLDFGLAKLANKLTAESVEATESSPTGAGQVVGTVGYMSPEQVRGLPIDHRTDIFSLGVVLYELLAAAHPFRRDTTVATLTAILDERPAELSSLSRGVPPALSAIVRTCLEKSREERFHSAHDLARSLEAVLQAPAGSASLQEVEEKSPYPGLSSFTEKDAAFFFGREAEVAALWDKILRQRLLAVIGPSGAGKTSFLRAGVLPARPEGWGAIHATPGANPGLGLAHALTPELAGDPEAMRDLIDGITELAQTGGTDRVVSAVRRWRGRHAEVLVVADQLEELFTLSPPETQKRFAVLLGRLAADAGVHVVLSLRDDFLLPCFQQEPLAPSVTPLTVMLPLKRDALRRAVVEPATKRGYRFEDDALVDEMVESVEGARSALPLLAFAVARLWEKRDRERKLLTREAYEEIGGVAGALAQHAEATMDRIGAERQALVREIFRNLATAQGTRAVVDREELLSAFPQRKDAEEVLRELIDARLVTSYEVEGAERQPSHHRVEVVHESLLSAWPRLVRWQAQDEEGALLRDQLKQAAHLWQEKGRTGDLLWTGTAFQEFELWRGRYAGALTALEEDFARAMREKARRRKRVITVTVASVIVALSAVAIAIGISRQQATRARDVAKAEALRAEASKLLALAQLRLADDPTEALAFTTASLELSDTGGARTFLMKVLWEAPPAFEMPFGVEMLRLTNFSPDGHALASAGHGDGVAVWGEDGRRLALLTGHQPSPRGSNVSSWTSSGLLVTGLCCGLDRRVRVWSIPGGTIVRTIDVGDAKWWEVHGDDLLTFADEGGPGATAGRRVVRSWHLPDGEPTLRDRFDLKALGASDFACTDDGCVYARGRQLFLRSTLSSTRANDRLIGQHTADISGVWPHRAGWISRDKSGQFRVWSPSPTGPVLERAFEKPKAAPDVFQPDATLRWAVGPLWDEAKARLWDLAALPSARPLVLRRTGSWYASGFDVHPRGDWIVVGRMNDGSADFWPLRRTFPTVVDGCSGLARPMAFSPDGQWLATTCGPGEGKSVKLWPVPGSGGHEVRAFNFTEPNLWESLAFDSQGQYLLAVGSQDAVEIVRLDGHPAKHLQGFSKETLLWAGAVSPSGRRIATAFGFGGGEKTLRVWDVESGAMKVLALPLSEMGSSDGRAPAAPSNYGHSIGGLAFADEVTLYTAGDGGLRRWNLESGTSTLLAPARRMAMAPASDGRRAVTQDLTEPGTAACGPIEMRDLGSGKARSLSAFGNCVVARVFALSADGEIVVAGSPDGTVRVGRASGDAHLLAGHTGLVTNVAISPDKRWVASAGEDNTLRLWPMPDLSQPPLHTLPREALIAKLHTLTNLRAVRDSASPTGWKIDLARFPGWKDVPTW
jgi:WD40 repeat protein